MAVEGHQRQGRRRHAGVHERAVARLLRDDEHSAARGTRLQTAATSRKTRRSRSSTAASPIISSREKRGRQAHRLGRRAEHQADIEIIGVVADSLYEGPREGIRRQVFIPELGKDSATFYVRTQTGSSAAFALIRNEVKQLDASMPVYEMKTRRRRSSTRRC